MDNVAQSSTTVPPLVDSQAQYLLDDIAKTVDGGAPVDEIQRVIDLCNVYHIAQPDTSSQVCDHPRPFPDD